MFDAILKVILKVLAYHLDGHSCPSVRCSHRVVYRFSLLTGTLKKTILLTAAASKGRVKQTELRVAGFIRRCRRSHYCPPDMPDIDGLMDEADERLFRTILNNQHHKLHALLPPKSGSSQNYQLRRRVQSRQASSTTSWTLD